MRIAVVTTNNPNMYSGGRYHSLGVALALSSIPKNEVYYITNHKPIFYDDFQAYNQELNLFLTEDFYLKMPRGKFDIVILVPHQRNDSFYPKVKLFSLKSDAKLVLINFESGNWFNEFSPRPSELWAPWKKACEIGCLMLSISKEGDKYARDFYTEYPSLTSFDYWYPRINEIEANRSQNIIREQNRILILSRITDKHKGSNDLNILFCEELRGHIFVLLVGSENLSDEFLTSINQLAERYGIVVEYKFQLSDYEKFIEYKKASVLIFPSYFEGYGYPPIEALYCDTPCIAYDLPVLREISNDGLIFVQRGNTSALKEAVISFFQDTRADFTRDLQGFVTDKTDFTTNSLILHNKLETYLHQSLSQIDTRRMIQKLKKDILQKNGIKTLKGYFKYRLQLAKNFLKQEGYLK